MQKIRYPEPLRTGDKIAITAPSSGVSPEDRPRLDLVLDVLRQRGFTVLEGECLNGGTKHVSAPRESRARELQQFWLDPEVKAILPPWGGELLIELLPRLDFEQIARSTPKWIAGYSDTSTLLFALTLCTGMATLHSSTLMDLVPQQSDPLTTAMLRTMSQPTGSTFEQWSSEKYQEKWVDFKENMAAPFQLTEITKWRWLNEMNAQTMSGRLIGGCLDTIARLAATPFADLAKFKKSFAEDGVILYFENCEMAPCELARTLWNLKLAGWFDDLNGVLIGRSAAAEPTSANALNFHEAVASVLGDLHLPILLDCDIGHKPPNLNLLNGARARVEQHGARFKVSQTLD